MYVFVLAAILLSIAPMHAQTAFTELSSTAVSERAAFSTPLALRTNQQAARRAPSFLPATSPASELMVASALPASAAPAVPIPPVSALYAHAPNAP